MKSTIVLLIVSLFSVTGHGYNIVCKAGAVTVQLQLASGMQHRMIILHGREVIGTQQSIYCGQRSAPGESGGSCNSHLTVGGDRRYRTASDFGLDFNYLTGNAPKHGGAGRALAKIKSTFRNLATGRTETLEIDQAKCSVRD